MQFDWSEEHQNFYDSLYDPEARDLQRDFAKGQPRQGEDAEELVRVWLCNISSHGECWSSSHLSTREVGLDAATCAPSCPCWRHTILAWTKSRKTTDKYRPKGHDHELAHQ